MEKKPVFWKSSISYGAITGLAMVVYSLLLYFLNLSFNQGLGYVSYLFLIAGIIYGVKEFREKELYGTITYGKAFSFSFFITLWAALIISVYSVLFVTVIDPQFNEKVLQLMEQKFIEQGKLNEQQIQSFLESSKKFMTPTWSFFGSLLWTTFLGSVLSLITSAFTKKNPDPFKTAMAEIDEDDEDSKKSSI